MRYRKSLYILAAAVVTVGLILAGRSFARYVINTGTDYQQAEAVEFYFESDLLSETEGKTYEQVCAGLKNAQITFELYNYRDELNISTCDINYTVQYKLRTQDEYPEELKQQKTFAKGTAQKETITLPLSRLKLEGTEAVVDVLVTASAPYKKELSASFTIKETVGTAEMEVYDSEGSNIATVYVTTGDVAGKVILTPPEGCLAEPASGLTKATEGNSVSSQAKANAQYSFVFLKTDPSKVYTNTDFGFELN